MPQTPTPLATESLPSKRLLSRVQEPPKGFKKTPKKPEAQDLPDPLLKMLFFSTEIDGFEHPSILPRKVRKARKSAQGYQKALKATKRLQKDSQKAREVQDLPDPLLKMRFFSIEIDGFGHPSILSPKGPGKHQKALKGFKKALKATKRLQKAAQKAGSPGFARPAIKNAIFSTEIDCFGHASILHPKTPGKPEKAPEGYQKALTATKRLQKPPKKPEAQDLPDPPLKMRFFKTEIDGFGRASILPPKRAGKSGKSRKQGLPKGFKSHQKASKSLPKSRKPRICQTRN